MKCYINLKRFCRHASYNTMATAFERLRLRLLASIGILKVCSDGKLARIDAGNPRVSGPNKKTSPVLNCALV